MKTVIIGIIFTLTPLVGLAIGCAFLGGFITFGQFALASVICIALMWGANELQ